MIDSHIHLSYRYFDQTFSYIGIDHDKYVLLSGDRNSLITNLKEQGIDTRLLFTGMHRQKAMRDFGCDCSGDYPVCDWLTENGFYLPSGSNLQEAQIERICDVIRKFANV